MVCDEFSVRTRGEERSGTKCTSAVRQPTTTAQSRATALSTKQPRSRSIALTVRFWARAWMGIDPLAPVSRAMIGGKHGENLDSACEGHGERFLCID